MKEVVNVQLIDFPVGSHSHESVTHNEDGSYTVFLNSRDAFNIQQQAYVHALKHIKDGDLTSDRDVQAIEAQAHELITEKPAQPKKRRKSRWEKYHAKQVRKEKALAKLGYRLEWDIVDDDYGCPAVKYKAVKI